MKCAYFKRKLSWCLISAAIAGSQVNAQEATEESIERGRTLEEVIVTGTAVERAAVDAPLAVTSFDDKELRRYAASNQADILRNVPGIKAEGGGGEVAVNLRVRGLPSAGQFQFTPLQYDGVTIFNTFGLNSSSFDVLIRNDLGIQQLEFVRAGVSNLFGTGSVAGIVNYISKNGQDDPGNTLQFEVAENGRTRADFYTGGELNDSTYYALSGFYRKDEGPLESGLDTKGGQLRGNIKHVFDTGSFTVSAQLIDDKAQFFLPLPLDSSDRDYARGNNGSDVTTVQTSAVKDLSYNTPTGRFNTPIEDGVTAKGGFLSFAYDQELGNDWVLNAKAKVADYDHEFNLFLNGDGITNIPLNSAGYLAASGYDNVSNFAFTNVSNGRLLGANDLVFGNRLLDRQRDAEEVTAELNFTKTFNIGNAEHNVTIGGYYADSEAIDVNYITTYVTEFNDAPDLVNVSFTDPTTGELVVVSDGGLVAGTQTSDNVISAKRTAFYLTDQIETDNWVFDLGLRYEKQDGDIFKRQFSATPLDIAGNPNASDRLSTSNVATGFSRGTTDADDIAVSLAALYKLTDSLNVYGNASTGFFFPQLRSVGFRADGTTEPYDTETIDQFEIGLKYSGDNFEGAIALFKTDLSNRLTVDTIDDPNNPGSLLESVSEQSTEAEGIEAYAKYDINEFWSFDANFILQDHEFTQDEGTPSNVGNELTRLPNTLVNLGVFFDNGTFDFGLYGNFNGDQFANDSNLVELDSYEIWRLNAGYTMQLADEDTLRFGLDVFNLTDDRGLAEGNPRAGNAAAGGGNFFVGRPDLPRRVTLKVTYDF